MGFWVFSDIAVQSGDVYIQADALVGSADGSLTAPGDVRIEIQNDHEGSLQLADLTIPEEAGGHLYIRRGEDVSGDFVAVTSTDDLNGTTTTSGFNDSGDSATPASFTLDVALEEDVPEITVVNNPSVSHTQTAHILLDGIVTNVSGDVTIDSGDGSVLTVGSIRAGDLSISSGGDFVLTANSTDEDADGAWWHAGGEVQTLWDDVASVNEAAEAAVSQPNAAVDGTASTIVADTVFISAEYLNINGTIQSGVPSHEITIYDSVVEGDTTYTLAEEIEGLESAYNDTGTALQQLDARFVDYVADIDDEIVVYWDAVEDRLELASSISVQGGHMTLIGHVFNTGGGHLKVMDGYGDIVVDNQSDYDLAITGSLSAGSGTDDETGIAGTINFIDTSVYVRVGGSWEYLQTEVTRLGSVVEVTYNDGGITDWNGAAQPVTTYDATPGEADTDTVHATYTPEAARYYWTSAYAEANATRYELTLTDGPYDTIGLSTIVNHPNTVSTLIRTQEDTEPLTDGEYLDENSDSDTFYTYDYAEYTTTGEVTGSLVNIYEWSWSQFKNVYDRTEIDITVESGDKEVHTHSVRADEPIDITFMGGDGLIDITSGGAVVFAAGVSVAGGTLNVDAGDAITSEGGEIEGKTIVLQAGTDIGNGELDPLLVNQTNVSGGSLTATTAAGNVSLYDGSGDLTVGQVSSSGDTYVAAGSGDLLSDGSGQTNVSATDTVTVQAAGSIGDAADAVIIDVGQDEDDVLNASATTDIYLTESTGDLYVEQIQSTSGNVTLIVPGNLLDAAYNDETSYDQDAIDDLETLWETLQLTGDAALQLQQEAIDVHVAQSNAQYERYWVLRNACATVDGSGVVTDFTFAYTDDERTALDELGYSASEIDALEADIDSQFTELDNVFGVGGTYVSENDGSFHPTTYDASFDYAYTASEEADWTDDLVWTSDELLWGLPSAVIERTTDTTTTIEDANISGVDVTITAGGGLGRNDAGSERIEVLGGDVTAISDTSTKVSLLSAEADDVTFYVWVDGNSDGEIGDDELAEWTAGDAATDFDQDSIVDQNEFNVIQVQFTQDVDFNASGSVTVTTNDTAFLGSEEDLRLGVIDTSDGAVDSGLAHTVRIKAQGAVLADGLTTANVYAEELVVEASGGNIGSEAAPLGVDVTGDVVVRSGADIYVEDYRGQLNLASAYADGSASFYSVGDIVDANDTSGLSLSNIAATGIYFEADNVGSANDPIEVEVDGDGELSANVETSLYLRSDELTLGELLTDSGMIEIEK